MPLAFPKFVRPLALDREARKQSQIDLDVLGSQEARHRANGQCEIQVLLTGGMAKRCTRKGYHTHHMIGGHGRRGRGISALAKHKQITCARCHSDITQHILQHIGGKLPLWTDKYRRIR